VLFEYEGNEEELEMNNHKEEDLYYCRSIAQFHFVKAKGFRYLYKEKNLDTGRFVWVFERTPKLLRALTMYATSNKNYLNTQGGNINEH